MNSKGYKTRAQAEKIFPLIPDPSFTFRDCIRISSLYVTFDSYAFAYKQASELLMSYITQNRIKEWPLVLPSLFLYRHYVELRLKSIILHTSEWLALPPRITGHKLDVLLDRSINLMNQAKQSPHLAKVHRQAKMLLDEFIAVDPGSTTFRYPEDPSGATTISFDGVHIRRLLTTISKLSINLELMRDVVCELDRDERRFAVNRKMDI